MTQHEQLQRKNEIQIKILQIFGGIINRQPSERLSIISQYYASIYHPWLPGWALFILVGIKLWKN